MPIIDAESWSRIRGTEVTGDDLSAATAICAAVDAALKALIAPFYPEPITITDAILDAPLEGPLVLPVVPVRSITSLYLHHGSHAVVADFVAADLLVSGTDYWLPIDSPIQGYSRSGFVYRVGGWGGGWGGWGGGYGHYGSPGRLAGVPGPSPAAVKVTFAAGPVSVPDDIFAAAAAAVTLLFNRRTTGMPVGSESWNGYSYSNSGPFTASGVLQTPDIAGVLRGYQRAHIG